nr:arylsulfatase [Bacteroidales bacterium]
MKNRFCLIVSILYFATNVCLAQDSKPNIMIIMVDDMGYSDVGCYGGEINTPNIDALAQNGLRFTQFYNCSRCCPTRASLLTGLYAQQVGLTFNGNSLSNDCVTIPEVLKEAGYNTGMSGKWHLSKTQGRGYEEQMKWLAHKEDYGVFSPLASYPYNRGFDEHWGIIWGVADYFDPFSLVHNETAIKTVPEDFYMTSFISEKAVHLIDTFSNEEEPFFMYVAYTAPHWPLHALPEDVAKYQGKYDQGWDVLRTQRYQRMVDLGIVDPETMPLAENESGRLWANEANKSWEADHMEVHAAMVDRVDQGVGDIIEKLKSTGEFDNTVIFFLSDNGASYERYPDSGFDRPAYTREGQRFLYPGDTYVADGSQKTMTGIGDAWAGALNTPFRYWKMQSFHGGNCTPLIVHWPEGLKTVSGSITKDVGHVMDIMPTCLDLAGAAYPSTYKGNQIQPLEAHSLVDIIDGKSRTQAEAIYWEHEGGRAVRVADWKLVALPGGHWQLFDLSKDLSETTNVVTEHPEVVLQLKELWNAWAKKMNLPIPVDISDTPVELVFYYPFNTDLQDKSPNDFFLTSPNSHAFSDGKFGESLSLNGTNQYLDLNTTGIINPQTTQFTVCAGLHNESTYIPQGQSFHEEIVLAQKDGSADNAGRIALYTHVENNNYRYDNFLGANENYSSSNSFERELWVHVAVVCD